MEVDLVKIAFQKTQEKSRFFEGETSNGTQHFKSALSTYSNTTAYGGILSRFCGFVKSESRFWVILICSRMSRTVRWGNSSGSFCLFVILSAAKNPYPCRSSSFLPVQKGCKDTTGEGEDSESLPPPRSPSPNSNGQKGVPFWISPCERVIRQKSWQREKQPKR